MDNSTVNIVSGRLHYQLTTPKSGASRTPIVHSTPRFVPARLETRQSPVHLDGNTNTATNTTAQVTTADVQRQLIQFQGSTAQQFAAMQNQMDEVERRLSNEIKKRKKRRSKAETVEVSANRPPAPRMVKMLRSGSKKGSSRTEFECCGEAIPSLEEMMKHVGRHSNSSKEHHWYVKTAVESSVEPQGSIESKESVGFDNSIEACNAAVSTAIDGLNKVSVATPGDFRPKIKEAEVELGFVAEEGSSRSGGPKTPAVVDPRDNPDRNTAPTKAAWSETAAWQPLAVRSMGDSKSVYVCNTDTFTRSFISYTFGGEQYFPGFFWVPDSGLLPSGSYWMLEGDFEPFGPRSPGCHGAKISPFHGRRWTTTSEKPEASSFLNVPVFMRAAGQSEHMYFGQYSRLHESDVVDSDHTVEHIPQSVLEYWAAQLAQPDRPEWVTQQLMEDVCSRPVYHGPIPRNDMTELHDNAEVPGRLDHDIKTALSAYAVELSQWESAARQQINNLSKDEFMKLLRNSGKTGPGLRFYLEYLQCVGYDDGLYDFLIQTKYCPKLRKPASACQRVRVSPEQKHVEDSALPSSITKPIEHATPTVNVSNGVKSSVTKSSPARPARQDGTKNIVQKLTREFAAHGLPLAPVPTPPRNPESKSEKYVSPQLRRLEPKDEQEKEPEVSVSCGPTSTAVKVKEERAEFDRDAEKPLKKRKPIKW